MNSKLLRLWLFVTSLILASLFALSLLADKAGYKNLLLITPSTFGLQGLDTERLNEITEDEFLLTYLIRGQASAQTVNSSHSVILVGTNHCFADVMGYGFSNGGFFGKTASDSKQKHATLNETAAFDIFGSVNIVGQPIKINRETWVITGVIRDNDEENSNIYAPASITGGRADSVMVLMDKTVTEAYAKNKLKDAGVRDINYDFLSLSKLAGTFYERFAVALKLSMLAAILLLTIMCGGRLIKSLRFYKDKLRELYITDLITCYRKDFLRTIAGIIFLAACISTMLILSLQILGTCLAWRELSPITGELTSGDFGHKLLWLENYKLFDEILFYLCIITTSYCLIQALFVRRKSRTGHLAGYHI